MSEQQPIIDAVLQQIDDGQPLDRATVRAFFQAIMDGRVDTPTLCHVLKCMAARGETIEEIVGAVEAMRDRVTPVRLPPAARAIDTCGTGGDGKPTFNVSSAVAIVAAAAGATVAKHGNRSHARPSGSAEGLAALGINIHAEVPVLERCLKRCRVAFLFAPQLHPAMKHAAHARAQLGTRTLFNLVGPLTNPAGVRRQLIGVPKPHWVEIVAAALRELGVERAMVVHGMCGLCDIALDGPSLIGRVDAGKLDLFEFDPTTVGFARRPLEEVFVTSAAESAARIEGALKGEITAAREMIELNAMAALWVAGIAPDFAAAGAAAAAAIDSGEANRVLQRWRVESWRSDAPDAGEIH